MGRQVKTPTLSPPKNAETRVGHPLCLGDYFRYCLRTLADTTGCGLATYNSNQATQMK